MGTDQISETGWEDPDLRKQDQEYAGVVPLDFDITSGTAWGKIPQLLAPEHLREGLLTDTEMDDAAGLIVSAPMVPLIFEMPRHGLTHGQAELARWLLIVLGGGVLRAFGRRAGGELEPEQWIPRAEWQRLTVRPAQMWRVMFIGGSAFKLAEDERAWTVVRVVEAKRSDARSVRERRDARARELEGGNPQAGAAAQIQKQQGTSIANNDLPNCSDRLSSATADSKTQQDKGGRPQNYDRDAFGAEFRRWRGENPRSPKHEANAYMIRWADTYDGFEASPSVGWVRERVRELWDSNRNEVSDS